MHSINSVVRCASLNISASVSSSTRTIKESALLSLVIMETCCMLIPSDVYNHVIIVLPSNLLDLCHCVLTNILLSSFSLPLVPFSRCMWTVRHGTHRISTREVPMCAGRVREESVSKSTQPLRQATSSSALASYSIFTSH